jgi:hypothetical protein
MANPRVPAEEHLAIDTRKSVSAAAPVTPPAASIRAVALAGASALSIETGPQPRRRLLLAPGIVAGTGLWGNSVPGPMANPGGWMVSAGNDHRPTEERRLPCRRYLLTVERPGRGSDRGRPRRAGALEGALRAGQVLHQFAEAVPGSTDASHEAKRGAKRPLGLTLGPRSVAARTHGYLVASLIRSRARLPAEQ